MPRKQGSKSMPEDEKSEEPAVKTAADDNPDLKQKIDAEEQRKLRPSGLSISPGLKELPGSKAPAMADGTEVSHVFGPQQSPVDPVAAGLDTSAHPLTRNDNRVVTQTGRIGAGNPPSTYAEKGAKPAEAPSDGQNVPAQPDEEADKAPGPNSTAG